MIWDLIEQSEFDKNFSRPDLTITTLLLDENIITQLKNQNPKLLDYINQHKQQFITELIEYTVVMPTQSDGYDRGHKLPYISSELLAIDSELIYEQFFRSDIPEESNKFWSQLLHFLQTAASQNEILMGYFEKVINNLYNGNKVKTTGVIARDLQLFVRLLHNGSIGDILKKSIILLNTPEGAVLTQRESILQEVVHRFVEGNQEVKTICSDILTEVANKFQAFSSGDVLIEKLLSNQELLDIYKTQHSSAINDFLVSLLKKSQQRVVNEKDESVRILTLPQIHHENLSQYLRNQVQNIHLLLANDSYILNQNRVLVRKSNKKIYSILGLSSLAIQQNLSDFITGKYINSLWNLLILFPYNNILQVSVVKIFTSIFKSTSPAKNILLDRYEEYLLQLYKNNFQMFKPLIFTIWKQAKDHPSVTNDQEVLQTFSTFQSDHLQPLIKYEINKNDIKHHQTQNKLIVDEEDQQNRSSPVESYPAETSQALQHHFEPPKDFEAIGVKTEEPPKDSFDFFSGWQTEPKEKPQQAKTGLFDDFSNFF